MNIKKCIHCGASLMAAAIVSSNVLRKHCLEHEIPHIQENDYTGTLYFGSTAVYAVSAGTTAALISAVPNPENLWLKSRIENQFKDLS